MTDGRQRVEPWPGAASINKRIPYGWFTRAMAAHEVGRSKDRIIQWEKQGDITPDGYAEFGQLIVPLYSVEGVEKIRHVAAGKRPGPKPQQQQHEEGPDETRGDRS